MNDEATCKYLHMCVLLVQAVLATSHAVSANMRSPMHALSLQHVLSCLCQQLVCHG